MHSTRPRFIALALVALSAGACGEDTTSTRTTPTTDAAATQRMSIWLPKREDLAQELVNSVRYYKLRLWTVDKDCPADFDLDTTKEYVGKEEIATDVATGCRYKASLALGDLGAEASAANDRLTNAGLAHVVMETADDLVIEVPKTPNPAGMNLRFRLTAQK